MVKLVVVFSLCLLKFASFVHGTDGVRVCNELVHNSNSVSFWTYVSDDVTWKQVKNVYLSSFGFDQAYSRQIFEVWRDHISSSDTPRGFSSVEVQNLLGLSRSCCNVTLRVTQDLMDHLKSLDMPALSNLINQDSFWPFQIILKGSLPDDELNRIPLLLPIKFSWTKCISLLRNDCGLVNDIFEVQQQMDLAKALFVMHLKPNLGWFQKPNESDKCYFTNCLTAAIHYWLKYNKIDIVDTIKIADGKSLADLPLSVRVAWTALTQIPRRPKSD